MFYINNYIDQDQLNQLYDLDQIKKSISNVDTVICKLKPILIKVTNLKLENARKKSKKKKIREKPKIKAITVKYYKTQKRINLFNIKKNYKNIIKDKIDLNKANNKYLLRF